jgi:hypothetical protein
MNQPEGWFFVLESVMPTASDTGLLALILGSAAMGSVAGEILKTVFSAPITGWFSERRKTREVFDRFKKPLSLASAELAHRLAEILEHYPTTFLDSKNLDATKPSLSLNSDEDEYFKKYKLVSTLYRFDAFLGWLELYRRETVFLQSGNSGKDSNVAGSLARIKSAIGDGHLNKFDDWKKWKDHLIFREELRAIGECMIRSAGSKYDVMGYADFEQFVCHPNKQPDRWLASSIHFFANLRLEKDFRKFRLALLLSELCDLIELLTDQPLSTRLRQDRSLAEDVLKQIGKADRC